MSSIVPECLIGDSKRLKQVIVNLLVLLVTNNSIKIILVRSSYNHANGVLKIVLFGRRNSDCEAYNPMIMQEDMS